MRKLKSILSWIFKIRCEVMFLFLGVFISDASLSPILAKYTLKEFAISIGSDKTRQL